MNDLRYGSCSGLKRELSGTFHKFLLSKRNVNQTADIDPKGMEVFHGLNLTKYAFRYKSCTIRREKVFFHRFSNIFDLLWLPKTFLQTKFFYININNILR